MKRKIGILGGSFNPVHFGHLNVAVEFSEKYQLDEVWFIPAKLSPHKTDQPSIAFEQRVAMLNLALENFPNFFVNEIEGERSPPSYTIDTIKSLKKLHPLDQFYFIIGSDAVENFETWKDPQEIVKQVPILVASRTADSSALKHMKNSPDIYDSLVKGYTKIRVMEISSTDIRFRLSNKLCCLHLMPEKVVDYIYKFGLYYEYSEG